MASLQNRPPLVVTVAHRPKARREFRFDQPEKADEYMAELKAAAGRRLRTLSHLANSPYSRVDSG